MTFEPPKPELPVDPQAAYHQMMDMLGQMLAPIAQAMETQAPQKDRRFQGAEWDHPLFALVRLIQVRPMRHQLLRRHLNQLRYY